MTINAKGELRVSVEEMKRGAGELLSAIHFCRKDRGQPLEGFDWTKIHGANETMAEMLILNAAQRIGIDLGGDRPGQVDVRGYG